MPREPDPPIYREIGALIASLRQDRRPPMSQQDLATAIGLSRTSVTNIEQGRHRIQIHVLYGIARALGTEPQELLPPLAAVGGLPKQFAEQLRPDERGAVERLVGHLPEA